MNGKTILVTGGAGFIGSNFVHKVYNEYPGAQIIVLDALTYSGDVRNLPTLNDDRIRFVYGDVRNATLVDSLVSESDIVVHFAAESHVTRSIQDDRIFFDTDVLGTLNVCASATKHGIERLVHVSTSEVYGTAETEYMGEDHPLNPMSPYAAAKAGADRLVYSYFTTHGLPAVIVRPFNNYGPRQHIEKAVPRFITACLSGETIDLHGGGSAERDYIHVYDTCEAICRLAQAPVEQVAGEAFNVGSGVSRSMLSVAHDVVLIMGEDARIIRAVEDRPGQVSRHTGTHGKILERIGWAPRIDWMTSLRDAAIWYSENREVWGSQLWARSVPIKTASGVVMQ